MILLVLYIGGDSAIPREYEPELIEPATPPVGFCFYNTTECILNIFQLVVASLNSIEPIE